MTVQQGIKSQLAKLLANEDLVVEHMKVESASFNIHTRVLTLPMWDNMSENVYDLLVSHEVGHALYTPNINWLEQYKISPQIVNIVEDARVEKLIKRRYIGLSKTFYNGYSEYADGDFLGIGNDDISQYDLANRINIYFKIGNFVDVLFNEEERIIFHMVEECEDFDDVLLAAKAIDDYCLKKNEEQEIVDKQKDSSNKEGDLNIDDEEDSNSGEEDDDSDKSYGGTAEQDQKLRFIDDNNFIEVKSSKSLEEKIKDFVDMNARENVYIEIPKFNLENVIIPNKEIHDRCEFEWSEFLEKYDEYKSFKYFEKKFLSFKRSSKKEINYLVKEFECKKAADNYSRSTMSNTGVLSTEKLHTYRFNEDLFKKISIIPDGKNHGLIFILDWSSSMTYVLLDTIKQLYNLLWFCKKVNIPFEVYAFTDSYPIIKYNNGKKPSFHGISYKKKEGYFSVNETFSMMNIFTSKVNLKTLEKQMKNIFYIATSYIFGGVPIPIGLRLSGTPLNESMMVLHQIIPKFQKENKLQKVHCIVLSDGEGTKVNYHREVRRQWESMPFIGAASCSSKDVDYFLRNRKTGNIYQLKNDAYKMTDVFLKDLRDSFRNTNFIGIRILNSSDVSSFIRRYNDKEYNKIIREWKKFNTFSIKNSGYHSYFGISKSSLNQNSEFVVSDDATKTQIKSAFVKSLRSKRMNKKILSEFIELIV